jgi:hypothetical protein
LTLSAGSSLDLGIDILKKRREWKIKGRGLLKEKICVKHSQIHQACKITKFWSNPPPQSQI